MLGMPGPLGTIIDLLAVMLGFGAIVFIHELGHFIAARWAGIRVLTFAVGFGPALLSYRRGIGLRKGSTLNEYNRRLKDPILAASSPAERNKQISNTEYRLSALPFGGYVQMLGQDDLDPTAVSQATDSYQSAPVWKRMVVISAGVVMNIILAAVLFVIVFNAGLAVEPPTVGQIRPESPAAIAEYQGTDPDILPGLKPGDQIISIAGHQPNRFQSVVLKAAMAKRGQPLPITVQRTTEGQSRTLDFIVTPEKSEFTGLLDIGVGPEIANIIANPKDPETRAQIRRELDRRGLFDLQPGDRITAVNGIPTPTMPNIRDAFAASDGQPATLTIERAPINAAESPKIITINAAPVAALQNAIAEVAPGESTAYEHLLGLVPVLRVADADSPAQGLAPGDVFRRVGAVEFPSVAAGIQEIRATAGKPIQLEVIRTNDADPTESTTKTINAKVKPNGTVGFIPSTTAEAESTGNTEAAAHIATLLAMPPTEIVPLEEDAQPYTPSTADWITRAGLSITAINDQPTASFNDIRQAIADISRDAPPGPLTLTVQYTAPFATEATQIKAAEWTITQAERDAIRALGWKPPVSDWMFPPTQTILKADNPFHAITLGLDETKRMMATVYVTFLRLTQGSLAVKNIKGPVGIAHVGTIVADKGVIWMLFFLGMISVNLAVVNFLPLPIVDGGQFLMLIYEGIRGKPVPLAVQSVVMTAGLILIASVFLVVTFNDIKGLLGI